MNDSSYFLTLPTIIDDLNLSPDAFRLYFHLKRITSSGFQGKVLDPEGIETYCKLTKDSFECSRNELSEAGLISCEGKTIAIIDIWPMVFSSVPPYGSTKNNNSINEKKDPGFVYLMESGPYHKIGFSQNPQQRLKAFKIALPHPITIKHEIKTEFMNKAEKFLHQRFSELRMNGEWFQLDESSLNWILSLNEIDNLLNKAV